MIKWMLNLNVTKTEKVKVIVKVDITLLHLDVSKTETLLHLDVSKT